jgi:phosphatidylserine/phosphatidylglycerophosphate/cardiolipin synthase-like enzyme
MPQPQVILETKDPIQVVNDQEYFEAVDPFLKNARTSIHIVMFNVNYYVKYPNSTMNFIIRDLIEAVDRGVDVKIVADEFQTTAPTIEYLRSKGIDIKFDDPKKTTHSKLIIIDGRIIIIGSTNWSYYATEKNHESNVIIVSEEVAQEFEEYFEVVWAET